MCGSDQGLVGDRAGMDRQAQGDGSCALVRYTVLSPFVLCLVPGSELRPLVYQGEQHKPTRAGGNTLGSLLPASSLISSAPNSSLEVLLRSL